MNFEQLVQEAIAAANNPENYDDIGWLGRDNNWDFVASDIYLNHKDIELDDRQVDRACDEAARRIRKGEV